MKSEDREIVRTEDKNKEEVTFEYTYSAARQKEIEAIKRKYIPTQETALEQLKRMDKEAERPGTIASLSIGITGILVFGTGLSCVLIGEGSLFTAGILIGCIGIVMMALAYPLYKKITKKRREQIAPRILELCQRIEK